ncbi:hypothetical protein BDY24DRAFT_393995 [Mrakia frigida]|uniref:uncharacterized protein n=1 Tax=Mrakia frigida TaxID=29902 RepID=UPI003FCC218A
MAPLLSSARAALASSSTAVASSSSSRVLLRPSLLSLRPSHRSYADAAPAAGKVEAPQAGIKRKDRVRVVKERLYEDFQYDETTGHGHEMIQAEREALAFMRTVELELPKLKPIPFKVPDISNDYLRFHTQKTWPLEGADSKESTIVTLSAPVVRLPFKTPAARHKFLLLTTPEYYHPFRPQAFDRYKEARTTYAYTSPTSPVYSEGSPATFLPPAVLVETIGHDNHHRTKVLYRAPVPRVGGWTPTIGMGAGSALEFDKALQTTLADRKGEDLDGWVSIKCGLFQFQLQNKKWCEDTLRRLVNEANDPEDPMDDIPLDLSPYFLMWKRQRRRADGSRISERDIPSEWNLTPDERAAMESNAINTSYVTPPPSLSGPTPSTTTLESPMSPASSTLELPPHMQQ